jgi:hypothetical protein
VVNLSEDRDFWRIASRVLSGSKSLLRVFLETIYIEVHPDLAVGMNGVALEPAG